MGTQLARQDLESMSLDQLAQYWTNLVFLLGIRPALEYIERADLSIAESIVLRYLGQGPQNVAAVATCLAITQSAASRSVDRLVHDGYVARQENPDDRRQKQLSLTPKGTALVEQITAALGDAAEPFLEVLNTVERAQLRTLLIRMLSEEGVCPVTAQVPEP